MKLHFAVKAQTITHTHTHIYSQTNGQILVDTHI